MAYLIPTGIFDFIDLTIFIILIGFTLGTALLAVTVKSVYHSVLWLIFSLLGIAMIFLFYAESELLLVVQMVVYTGGITVLMLFAISLSGRQTMFEKPKGWKLLDRRLSFGGAFILFVISYYLLSQISSSFWRNQTLPSGDTDVHVELIQNIAIQLFTVHSGTIIILGLLLLATMLGSVYLVKKEVENP
jgi:NADH-quinone oxidoreductase subunit J